MAQTILLIEDDPLGARLAELILQSEGYHMIIAPNGLQGLKIAHENPPDLILLDLMLPGLDGFEVLNRLRGDPQTAGMRVVIVSSKTQPADKHTAAKLGVDGYLTKPYKKNELLDVLRPLLSEQPAQAIERGRCVLLVGPRGDEATPAAAGIGTALAAKGEKVVVVDLRPFSVACSLLLGVTACPAPVSFSDVETMKQLAGLMVQCPSGLCLLNNLEGSGEAGQITPEDVKALLDVLLAEGGFVLVDLPLYPADVLRQAAGSCDQVILVVRDDPASLAAARSALALMDRAGVEKERTGVVAIGSPAAERLAELEREVLDTLPTEAGPDAPAFETLADRLRSLK